MFNPHHLDTVKPNAYRVVCKVCGYTEFVELQDPNFEVFINPECEEEDAPRLVNMLPTHCPKCSGAVSISKIQVKIRY